MCAHLSGRHQSSGSSHRRSCGRAVMSPKVILCSKCFDAQFCVPIMLVYIRLFVLAAFVLSTHLHTRRHIRYFFYTLLDEKPLLGSVL